MKRTLLSLVMLLGLVLSPTAAAQPAINDQAYTSEVTGDEVDLGTSGDIQFIPENFSFNETSSFQEEYIWFTHGWSNFQLVLISGPNDAESYHTITLANMEEFYDSWELIGEELTDEHSWFLGEGEVAGIPLIVYYEFELDAFGDVDLVVMQFTDITSFAQDLEFVQEEVTVGGNPLLPDTDTRALSSLAGHEIDTPDASPEGDSGDPTDRTSRTTRGGTDSTDDGDEDDGDTSERTSRTTRGGTDSTDEVDEDESTPESSSRSSRTSGTDTTEESDRESRAGRLGDIRTSTGSETEDDSTPVAGGDWDSMGLISDTEWESPSLGHVITWDSSTWEFPLDYDSAIVINDDPAYDILTLQTVDGFGYVYITVDAAYESTPRSLVEYWATEEYQDQISSDVTVLDTATTGNTASIVYQTTNTIDQPLVVVLEATFLDGDTVIFSQISGAPDTIDHVYEQYLNGVEVDDAPLEMTWTVEDIRDITTP